LLVAADAVLAVAVSPLLAALVQPLVAAIAWLLHTLWRAEEGRPEQLAIGLGARLGNGLLTCVLAWLLVTPRGATTVDGTFVTVLLEAVFLTGTASLAATPQRVVIGYKG
jgi:hypothetical protein